MAREVTMELCQQLQFGTERQIQLLDNRELRIVDNGKRGQREYSVDLLALAAPGKSRISIAWRWLVAAIAIPLIAFNLIPYLPASLAALYITLIKIVSIVLAIGFLYLFWRGTTFKRFFYSKHARIPIVDIVIGKPSLKEYNRFVERLEKRIIKLGSHFNLSRDQQLSGEMRMLRRLIDKKIVSESEYKRAKSKLFDRFGG